MWTRTPWPWSTRAWTRWLADDFRFGPAGGDFLYTATKAAVLHYLPFRRDVPNASETLTETFSAAPGITGDGTCLRPGPPGCGQYVKTTYETGCPFLGPDADLILGHVERERGPERRLHLHRLHRGGAGDALLVRRASLSRSTARCARQSAASLRPRRLSRSPSTTRSLKSGAGIAACVDRGRARPALPRECRL